MIDHPPATAGPDLNSKNADLAERNRRLEAAMEEVVRTLDADEPLDRKALLSKYSDVADELAACLSNLDFIHNVAPQLAEPSGRSTARIPTTAEPTTLGDFRILREIGRGGMGVVYEAEQLSLNRRMALKVLPFAAMLDRQQIQRFKNEARAAATLDHPHIVAVHSVGEERGVHYYAMQLIDGQSLAEVIAARQSQLESEAKSSEAGATSELRESDPDQVATVAHQFRVAVPQASIATKPVAALSTSPNASTQEYFRTIAQLGIQAAEALDHAHQYGIVHRDVKPGNLLVDAEGQLHVTDFGLARIEADAGMTMTGDLLGTLRYMSPEQALAKRVVIDHRTDIYSLGVTLYELLTLQPPYQGNDRQELLKRIAFDEPRRLRQINSRIPVDLETIVAKAIEKSPDDRYDTAQEVACDLRRFLSNDPILAKPPSLVDRGVKWSRRHAPLVWTAAVGILLVSVMTTWFYAAHVFHQRAIAAAVESSLMQTGEALSVNQIGLARVALGQAQVQAKQLKNARSPLRQKIDVLNQELVRYEEFDALYQQARNRRGEVHLAKSALEVYEAQKGDSWETLLRQSTAPQAHIDRVVEQFYELLILLAHEKIVWIYREKTTEAKLAAIAAAQSYLEQAATIRDSTKGYYWVLASCSQRMGDLTESDVRDHHDAEALRLRALADETPPQNAAELFYISRDRRWGCASDQVRPAFRQPFATGEVFAAYREMLRIEPQYYNALFFAGLQYGGAEENYEAAIAMFSGCLALWPRDSTALGNRANCLADLGRHEESLIDAAKSVEIARELFASDEKSTVLLSKLAGALLLQGECRRLAGDVAGVRAAWEESKAIYDALAKEDPNYWPQSHDLLIEALAKLDSESLNNSEGQSSSATPEAVQQEATGETNIEPSTSLEEVDFQKPNDETETPAPQEDSH